MVIIVSGNIGSGKSTVCDILSSKGFPVYDCDSRAKAMYALHPSLAAMLKPDIFQNAEALSDLENALFPVLMDDIKQWMAAQDGKDVVVESATILQKEFFDGFGDFVIWVTAPQQTRLARVLARGGISKESALQRMKIQCDQSANPRVGLIIENTGSLDELKRQIDNFLKHR